MVDSQLRVAVREVLNLLLLRQDLLVHQVDLLSRHAILAHLSRLTGRGCLSSDIIERIFAVCFELRVFEFPSLQGVSALEFKTVHLAVGSSITDILSIRRLARFFVVLSDLVEVILVQLTHETGEVAMLEMLG